MLELFKDIRCTAHGKFLLMKLAELGWSACQAFDSIPNMAARLFMSEYQLRQSIRDLKQLDIIITPDAETRSIKIYGPADLIARAHGKLQVLPHRSQISSLLSIRPIELQSTQHELKIPQRVLMIALLEKANAGGRVDGVGFQCLSLMAGINKRQVKNQVDGLKRRGYIRIVASGGNNPKMLGYYESIYWLDLNSYMYGVCRKHCQLLVLTDNQYLAIREGFFFHNELRSIYRRAADIGAGRNKNKLDHISLHVFFSCAGNIPAGAWVNIKHTIYILLSDLLNSRLFRDRYSDIEGLSTISVPESLKRSIRERLFRGVSNDDAKLLVTVFDYVSQRIFSMAIKILKAIDAAIESVKINDLEYIQVIPPDNSHESAVAIEVFIKGSAVFNRDISVFNRKETKWLPDLVEYEQDGIINDDFRQLAIQLGLASKIKPLPKQEGKG